MFEETNLTMVRERALGRTSTPVWIAVEEYAIGPGLLLHGDGVGFNVPV